MALALKSNNNLINTMLFGPLVDYKSTGTLLWHCHWVCAKLIAARRWQLRARLALGLDSGLRQNLNWRHQVISELNHLRQSLAHLVLAQCCPLPPLAHPLVASQLAPSLGLYALEVLWQSLG